MEFRVLCLLFRWRSLSNRSGSSIVYDFRRLPYGMPGSISHDTPADGMTGPERRLIGAKIQEKDSYSVMLFLNQEIKLLFERGINLF